MPQVVIGLSARDFRSTNDVWRLAKRHLNPAVRRKIGWRGRSSFLRELALFGFERASEDPAGFLRSVRDTRDPLFGRRGRGDAAAERREALVAAWERVFPTVPPAGRGRRVPAKPEPRS
jgi:hypothetical protein